VVLKFDAESHHGIVCLYCGTRTMLPPAVEKRLSFKDDVAPKNPVFLVRCRLCLKEAPYGPEEIVAFQDVA